MINENKAGQGEAVAYVSEESFSSDGTSDIITRNLPIGTALYAALPPSTGEFIAAYQGAREDLAIWKRRALESERRVREQDQIIDHLTLEAQGETRFGEPALSNCVADERGEFEVAARKIHKGDLRHLSSWKAGGYYVHHINEMWEIWQARARLPLCCAVPGEPYGYLREVDGQVQLSVGPARPADRSGGCATPWAAIFAAPPASAEAVSVPREQCELEWLEHWLLLASEPVGQECCNRPGSECCGCPDTRYRTADDIATEMHARHAELRALLAQSQEVQ